MNFKVGDVCVIVLPGGASVAEYWHPLVGTEVTILGVVDSRYYLVDLRHNGKPVEVRDDHLRLKRPPSNYDGNQLGEWDLVPWRPAKERVG